MSDVSTHATVIPAKAGIQRCSYKSRRDARERARPVAETTDTPIVRIANGDRQ
jgi:hypothetical protein